MTNTIQVGWEEVEGYCRQLAKQIQGDIRGKPNTLVAVSRGGIVPATLMSYELGMSDIEVIHPMLSQDRLESDVKFLQGLYTDFFNVLIVDDILKTGITIEAVMKFPHFNGVRVACFHVMKGLRADLRPDYFIDEVDQEVIYPWRKP